MFSLLLGYILDHLLFYKNCTRSIWQLEVIARHMLNFMVGVAALVEKITELLYLYLLALFTKLPKWY